MNSETSVRTDFDYSALSQPVTNHDAGSHIIWSKVGTIFLAVLIAVALAVSVEFLLHNISLFESLNIIAGTFILFGVILTIVTYVAVHAVKERIRLKRFAEANKLIFYVKQPSGEKQTGAIFNVLDAHNQELEVVRSPGDPFYEFGNYSYVIGEGKNQIGRFFGFVHFKLSRHLPNILLSSHQDDHLTKKLPLRPDTSQRLSLEGNFDDYFSLFVPKGYEEDALTIFTPDVMQMMIEAVHAYTCEIVDDDFYIYTDQFKSKDPGQFQEVLSILTILIPEFERQTHNYRDDRVGMAAANTIADPGKHLRRRPEILLYALYIMAFGYLIFAVIVFGLGMLEL